jgi:hypothetical protein
VAGHFFPALINRATRPSLREMLPGEVDREWASKDYPRWTSDKGMVNSQGSGSVLTRHVRLKFSVKL